MTGLGRLAATAIATAALTAGIASSAEAAEESARHGDVRATLSWEDGPDFGWAELWVTVTRAGETAYDGPIGIASCEEYACAPASQLGLRPPRAVHVRNLDRDAEPEVAVGVATSTGRCCNVQLVLDWDGDRYVRGVHDFKMAAVTVADLDGDGRAEFSSSDSRFRYAFAAGAWSWYPPQVWALRGGRFVDVTRAHPRVVRADAGRVLRLYKRELRGRYPDQVGALLAGWVADQRLLGRNAKARRFLAQERAAGHLDGLSGLRTADRFLQTLEQKLRAWGY